MPTLTLTLIRNSSDTLQATKEREYENKNSRKLETSGRKGQSP